MASLPFISGATLAGRVNHFITSLFVTYRLDSFELPLSWLRQQISVAGQDTADIIQLRNYLQDCGLKPTYIPKRNCIPVGWDEDETTVLYLTAGTSRPYTFTAADWLNEQTLADYTSAFLAGQSNSSTSPHVFMKAHLKTLRFLGKDMPYLEMPDGSNQMFIRLICDALGVDADRQIRDLKIDEILGGEVSEQTTRLPGEDRARPYTCLPEKFIYGWVFGIKSSNTMAEKTKATLAAYKREAYEALFQHFHGYIAPVKQAVTRKASIAAEIARLRAAIEENSPAEMRRLRELTAENKAIGNPLQRLQNTQFKLAYHDAQQDEE